MEREWRFIDQKGREIWLRPARPEDAEGILSSIASVARERSFILTENVGRTVEEEAKYIANLDTQHNLLLVALHEDKVIGGLGASQAGGGKYPKLQHVLEIGLHLVKDYREAGIGSQMLAYAIEWAKEKGFGKLTAQIFTTNRRSIHLFEKHGFQEEGRRKRQYRIGSEYIDEVMMGLLL
ncbi:MULTISPECIES: GNAT family N-acetyltransferase [Carboxydocella]|uniref:L-amino acid N-acyltransferase YncA n=2 Tax=Carboxydocella TaxID=178898 RepID=A0A1T4P6R9_9FIRM|nr:MULTISPECIES: GNAT family N-acetyltransferase [Carboxydocella]AVX20725.1 L-amino acid N-acyltransferase YncA [Carboxydocella thermautotrophica]AVX31144.1 L-amino acid N-acyltransferase YncA [Carboxydocella thermautotrophica]SJZ87275.1 L-amino acid N-acyltransferase YncA [Carboxydocella sporoproducens DSM 16521]GAW28254.1 hypothetical protein ULO1_08240 [Carboxydocella sp. ULO1]GAW30713.1 hypothetical protein JDF658_04780 [Carboxydocella sp. JDF658]